MRFPRYNTQVYTQPTGGQLPTINYAKPVKAYPKFRDTTATTIASAVLEAAGNIGQSITEYGYKTWAKKQEEKQRLHQMEIQTQANNAVVKARRDLTLRAQKMMGNPDYNGQTEEWNNAFDEIKDNYMPDIEEAQNLFEQKYIDFGTDLQLKVADNIRNKQTGATRSSIEKLLASGIQDKSAQTIDEAIQQARDSKLFLKEQIDAMEEKALYDLKQEFLQDAIRRDGWKTGLNALQETNDKGEFSNFTWLKDKDRAKYVDWAKGQWSDVITREQQQYNTDQSKMVDELTTSLNNIIDGDGPPLTFEMIQDYEDRKGGYPNIGKSKGLDPKTGRQFRNFLIQRQEADEKVNLDKAKEQNKNVRQDWENRAKSELADFKNNLPTMTMDEAREQWIELYNTFNPQNRPEEGIYTRTDVDNVLGALQDKKEGIEESIIPDVYNEKFSSLLKQSEFVDVIGYSKLRNEFAGLVRERRFTPDGVDKGLTDEEYEQIWKTVTFPYIEEALKEMGKVRVGEYNMYGPGSTGSYGVFGKEVASETYAKDIQELDTVEEKIRYFTTRLKLGMEFEPDAIERIQNENFTTGSLARSMRWHFKKEDIRPDGASEYKNTHFYKGYWPYIEDTSGQYWSIDINEKWKTETWRLFDPDRGTYEGETKLKYFGQELENIKEQYRQQYDLVKEHEHNGIRYLIGYKMGEANWRRLERLDE